MAKNNRYGGFHTEISGWKASFLSVWDESSAHQEDWARIGAVFKLKPSRVSRTINLGGQHSNMDLEAAAIVGEPLLRNKILRLKEGDHVIIIGALSKRFKYANHLADKTEDNWSTRLTLDALTFDDSNGANSPFRGTVEISNAQLFQETADLRYKNFCVTCGTATKPVGNSDERVCPSCLC